MIYPPKAEPSSTIEWTFRISLLFKAAIGLFQVLAGVALLMAPPGALPGAVRWLIRTEIVEDPSDPVVGWLSRWAETFTPQVAHFYEFYFLSHGMLHFFVVMSLLLKWRVAYPFSLGTLCAFVVYQTYRYTQAPDLALIVLTAIDIFVIVIVVLEHRQGRQKAAQIAPAAARS